MRNKPWAHEKIAMIAAGSVGRVFDRSSSGQPKQHSGASRARPPWPYGIVPMKYGRIIS
jgi:hypothetical protein